MKKLVLAALFAAIIAAVTFFVKIPVGNGYVHVGDSVVYLAACVLPMQYALIAAGMGGALADLLGGYAYFIIPSFIIKALITLPFYTKDPQNRGILTKRSVLATVPSGVITVIGYFIAGWIPYREGAFVGLAGDTVQAIGSAVMFVAIAAALDRIRFRQRIDAYHL